MKKLCTSLLTTPTSLRSFAPTYTDVAPFHNSSNTASPLTP